MNKALKATGLWKYKYEINDVNKKYIQYSIHHILIRKIIIIIQGGINMKHSIQTKNIYKNKDTESMKQAVTAKIERLLNKQLRKA